MANQSESKTCASRETLTAPERKDATGQMGRYGIIYADPPWRYDNGTPGREVERHYPTMSDYEICALSVPVAADSILYLWATAPRLESAFRVIAAWGFAYKTGAVWDKEVAGMGYWFRGQHELLLVGTRGNVSPPPASLRISSVIRCRRGRHSSKPDYVRDVIAKWLSECCAPRNVFAIAAARLGFVRESGRARFALRCRTGGTLICPQRKRGPMTPLDIQKLCSELLLCKETLQRIKGYLAGQRDSRHLKYINLIKKALGVTGGQP